MRRVAVKMRVLWAVFLSAIMLLSSFGAWGDVMRTFAAEGVTPGTSEEDLQTYTVNDTVRITPLSKTVVRLEQVSSDGTFVDADTYYVTGRKAAADQQSLGTITVDEPSGDFCYIVTNTYKVKVAKNAKSLTGTEVLDLEDNVLYTYKGDTTPNTYLPSPSDDLTCWYLSDSPRIIPSANGYAATLEELNGWDFDHNAPDMYVFLPGGSYKQFCYDYTRLTGETNMLELQTMGYWDSRWYAYSAEEAIQQIKDYQDRGYSIDVMTIDTNWRTKNEGDEQPPKNRPDAGGVGYNIDKRLFPDMAGFLQDAHDLGVNITFNDHPEPVTGANNGLEYNEIEFRSKNLKLILSLGLDFWWYDRNWSVSLRSADPEISVFAFGMYAFQFITDEYYQEQVKGHEQEYARRAQIMGNVDGCLNGWWKYASDTSAHRYSLQWTGDINSDAESLQREIRNSVFGGAENGIPYMSSDIGGHTQSVKDDMYTRWMQYGALSTICRVHCTHSYYIGDTGRMPWLFGDTAESVTKTYLGMRYNLLPTYYSLAGENVRTGLPILRRLDIEYPQYVEASRNDEYLLGEGILIAPISEATDYGAKVAPASLFTYTDDGGTQQRGLKKTIIRDGSAGNLFNLYLGDAVSSDMRGKWDTDPCWDNAGTVSGETNFGMEFGGDHNFAMKLEGTFNVGSTDTQLQFYADDGVMVWIDGVKVVSSYSDELQENRYDNLFKTDFYKAGTSHTILIKYFEAAGNNHFYMYAQAKPVKGASECYNTRTVFIPDGVWMDVWSGKEYVGPYTYSVTHTLETSPIFVRKGSLTVLAPDMKNTSEKDWSELTVDAYPGKAAASYNLYEDDTTTQAYKDGGYRETKITSGYDNGYTVTINPAVEGVAGKFTGDKAFGSRKWNIRIHAFKELGKVTKITLDGKEVRSMRYYARYGGARPFTFDGEAPTSDIYEFSFNASVTAKSVIKITFADDGALCGEEVRNQDYDASAATFTVNSAVCGSTVVDLTSGTYTDYAVFGATANNVLRKQGGEGYVSDFRSEFDLFDSLATPICVSTESGDLINATRGAMVDIYLTLKVKGRSGSDLTYYTLYLYGEKCSGKLMVRDRSGENVKTIYVGDERKPDRSSRFMSKVVIAASADEDTELTVRFSAHSTTKDPQSIDSGRGGSLRLAIPLVTVTETEPDGGDETMLSQVTATCLDTATAPNTAYDLSATQRISNANRTPTDWVKTNANNNVEYLYKDGGDNIRSVTYTNRGAFYDYRTPMKWTDGEGGSSQTSGDQNGWCTAGGQGGTIEVFIKIDANTKFIRIFTGTWQSTNNTALYDLSGNVIASAASFSAGGSSECRMITFEVNATGETYVRVSIRSVNEQGGNVSLSAVQVFA